MVLNTRIDFPADNLAQFIAYVKANSAKLQFGSTGAGTTTHLGCALLNAEIGVNVTHVPYRGGGPATNDLMGGQCGAAATPAVIPIVWGFLRAAASQNGGRKQMGSGRIGPWCVRGAPGSTLPGEAEFRTGGLL
jgi:hypothetical protein